MVEATPPKDVVKIINGYFEKMEEGIHTGMVLAANTGSPNRLSDVLFGDRYGQPGLQVAGSDEGDRQRDHHQRCDPKPVG